MPILPTLEETERFWALIEDAWAPLPADVLAARDALIARAPGQVMTAETATVEGAMDDMLDNLRAVFRFEDYPAGELVAMDRVLERALYLIDREDIHDVTDGSDDGFLYARGFIVAMGKRFYGAVLEDPDMAIDSAECESMCYLPAQVHNDRFGAYPETDSDISRESNSNGEGWGGEIEIEES